MISKELIDSDNQKQNHFCQCENLKIVVLKGGGTKLLAFLIGLLFCVAVNAQTAFKVRAVHIDNRIQVVPIEELKRLASRLQQLDMNAIVMEWEGSFPFDRNHVISNRFSYAQEEVKEFIAHCSELGIEVIPLQQSIGHLEYVLKHERYAALREDIYDVSQICPLQQEAALDLYEELIDEIIQLHPSKYIHIGGDETALLGHCPKCKKYVKEHGKSKLFIGYIKAVSELLVKKGKIPLLWADIVMKHPEAIEDLPAECILVNWNYGWDIDLFGDHDNLLQSGHKLWGALALRSHPDNFFQIGWAKHFENIEDFIPFMRKTGYEGVVMTSWSTSGVYTYLREPRKHIVEMFPVRHVYPMAGFDLLLSAYGDALKSDDFDGEQYALQYCQQQFGMNEIDAKTFWEGITSPTPNLINGESTLPINRLRELDGITQRFCDFLNQVEISKDRKSFEHFKLMYEVRSFYLKVQIARAEIEAMRADSGLQKALTKRLKDLAKRGGELDRWFGDVNKDNLHPAAIEIENYIRNRELNVLINKVAKQR